MEEKEIMEVMEQLEAENNELRNELANKAMITTKSANNTEYFTNINGVYAKDIDGRAETAELRTLVDGIDIGGYSTTERKIGKWIDGSDLYQRTFEVTGLVNGQWNTSILGTSGINIVDAPSGIIYWLDSGEPSVVTSLNFYRNSTTYATTFINAANDLDIFPNIEDSITTIDKAVITIKYTKPSAQANLMQTAPTEEISETSTVEEDDMR